MLRSSYLLMDAMSGLGIGVFLFGLAGLARVGIRERPWITGIPWLLIAIVGFSAVEHKRITAMGVGKWLSISMTGEVPAPPPTENPGPLADKLSVQPEDLQEAKAMYPDGFILFLTDGQRTLYDYRPTKGFQIDFNTIAFDPDPSTIASFRVKVDVKDLQLEGLTVGVPTEMDAPFAYVKANHAALGVMKKRNQKTKNLYWVVGVYHC